ncbi:MAG: O-antigen ligase family protein [Candidatus Latescibacteria bacterium]|nr:O-antigen ligase family protein [Candidatus Latescibacterota bacterium]
MSLRDTASANILGFFVLISLLLSCIFVAYVLATQNVYWVTGAVLAVVLFAVGFLSPKVSLYILIFSMLLSPEIGARDMSSGKGFTIRFEDLLLIIMGFAWIARSAVHKEIGLALFTRLNRPIFLYTLACIVSTAWGVINGFVNSPLTGLMFVMKYIEYFIIFFITMNNVDSKAQLRKILGAMFITFIIILIYGFMQIPMGNRISTPFEGKDLEPNSLGGYIVIMMSLSLALFTSLEKSYKKFSMGVLCFLSFIALLYTLSRSSWLAMGVMYIGMLFFTKRRIPLVLALVAGLVIAPFTLPSIVLERIMYTFRGEREGPMFTEQEMPFVFEGKIGTPTYDSSTTARLDSMHQAMSDFMKHPILGYGITGHMFLDAQYHRVLVETGIIGMAAFIYLLWMTGSQLLKIRKQYGHDILYHTLSVGTFCAFLGLLAHAVGTNSFIIVRLMEPFWCLVALNLSIPYIEGDAAKGSAVKAATAKADAAQASPLTPPATA